MAKGRKHVVELQNTMQALESNVDSLSSEVEIQREQADRFAESLKNTQKLMESTLEEVIMFPKRKRARRGFCSNFCHIV